MTLRSSSTGGNRASAAGIMSTGAVSKSYFHLAGNGLIRSSSGLRRNIVRIVPSCHPTTRWSILPKLMAPSSSARRNLKQGCELDLQVREAAGRRPFRRTTTQMTCRPGGPTRRATPESFPRHSANESASSEDFRLRPASLPPFPRFPRFPRFSPFPLISPFPPLSPFPRVSPFSRVPPFPHPIPT